MKTIKPLLLIAVFFPSLALSEDINSIYTAAKHAHQQGDYQKEEEIATEGLKKFPGDLNLLTFIGDAQNFSGQYSAAIQTYRAILKREKSSPEVKGALCSALVNHGDYQEAIVDCKEARAADPTNGTAWFNGARALAGLSQYQAAKDLYKKYLQEFEKEADPDDIFIREAREEVARLTMILENHAKNGVQKVAPPAPMGGDEKALLAEIQRRYEKLGMGAAEAEDTVSNLRKVWSGVPAAQRKGLMIQTRDALPE